MSLQSPTATLIPLVSSSELTGCGYPGLLDRKNRSDMCPRWESNPRLPACKASTLSTRPGSPLHQNRSNDCSYIDQVFRHFFTIRIAMLLSINTMQEPTLPFLLKIKLVFFRGQSYLHTIKPVWDELGERARKNHQTAIF